MKRRHFIFSMLAVFLLVNALCSPVCAEFGYSGELDPETGLPEDSGSEDAYSSRVTVTDGVYYDRERQGYLYSVTDGTQILCSVANGMVVQEEVWVEPDAGVEVTVYRDGTALDQPDLTHLNETGGYVVELNVNGQKYQALSFTIVGDTTCRLTGYTMPDGFTITGVTLDGQESYFERGYVSMTQDGHYVVDYGCTRNGRTYELDVVIDTTPPVLELPELNEKNQARGPVSLEGIEEGASVSITLDGRAISYTSELTESGEYQVVLTDRAGNVSRYTFTILIYFNLSSWLFVAIVLIVAVAVGAYIIISRKKLVVR